MTGADGGAIGSALGMVVIGLGLAYWLGLELVALLSQAVTGGTSTEDLSERAED